MAYSKQTREQTRKMYVHDSMTIIDISKMLNIPEKTIQRWKKVEDWDGQITKTSNINLAVELTEAFRNKVKEAIDNNQIGDPKTADALLKTAQITEKIMPKRVMLSNILEMLKAISGYIQQEIESEEFKKNWGKYLPEIADYLKKKWGEE